MTPEHIIHGGTRIVPPAASDPVASHSAPGGYDIPFAVHAEALRAAKAAAVFSAQ
ncbi:hypothetical protein [Janthinobacterium sp. JC611]|uniref:hypothetical protein n=1 Tax=Janthinobacterium sp. JC611 TaxID=2816201 RepID=UPI001BFE4452|nr:hypothetical protein [Janthinobacterium sp. JC611]